MPYFVDAASRQAMELVPGARTRTFWGENMLLSMVEIDADSEMPRYKPGLQAKRFRSSPQSAKLVHPGLYSVRHSGQ